MWLSFDGHPAIAHLSWEDRARLANQALKRLRRRPAFWIEGALASLVTLSAGAVLYTHMADRDQVFSVPMLAVPCLMLLLALWWFSRVRRLFGLILRHILLEEGIRPRVCLECGQDLRAERGEECPTCGTELMAETCEVN